MKHTLLTLSACAFAMSQLWAVNITGGKTAEEATLISNYASQLEGNTFLWKGLNKNASSVADQMVDAYVRIDTDVSMLDFKPSGGGGPHSNAIFLFDNGTSMNVTNNINYNDYGDPDGDHASYAVGLYFATEAGNTASVNFAGKQTFDLNCTDNTYVGNPDYTTFGNFGRIVSVGEGITFNSADIFTVKGSEPNAQISGSNFILDGTINSNTAVIFRDTLLTQSATGVVKATTDLKIENTNATIDGALYGDVVWLGGDVLLGATSKVEASVLALTGGNVTINGTAQNKDGSALLLKVNKGETNLTTNSDVKVGELKMDAGTLNLQNSMTVQSINLVNTAISTIKTAEGTKLTITDDTTLETGTNLVLSGNVEFKDTLVSKGTLSIEKGTSVAVVHETEALAMRTDVGSTLNVYGDLTVTGVTGSWHSNSGMLRGTVNVDGGSLVSNSAGKYSSAFQVSNGGSLSIKNGGSIYTKTNVFLQVDNGTVVTDGTASIDVGGLMFANGTQENSITIAKASELKSKSVIFAQGGSNGNTSKMDLKLLSGDYAFSAIWSLRKAELHLYLGDDATVSFDKVVPQSSAANAELTLVLHDFTLNTIKLGNVDNDMISGNVIDLGSNDTYTRTVTLIGYDKNQNLLDANSWYIDNNGFLANYALAVPEPAEWAIIFGGIALGFAIYRRRK